MLATSHPFYFGDGTLTPTRTDGNLAFTGLLEDCSEILVEMRNGKTADPAAWFNWSDAIKKTLEAKDAKV